MLWDTWRLPWCCQALCSTEIRCIIGYFFTDMLSWKVCNKLPIDTARYPRRGEMSIEFVLNKTLHTVKLWLIPTWRNRQSLFLTCILRNNNNNNQQQPVNSIITCFRCSSTNWEPELTCPLVWVPPYRTWCGLDCDSSSKAQNGIQLQTLCAYVQKYATLYPVTPSIKAVRTWKFRQCVTFKKTTEHTVTDYIYQISRRPIHYD